MYRKANHVGFRTRRLNKRRDKKDAYGRPTGQTDEGDFTTTPLLLLLLTSIGRALWGSKFGFTADTACGLLLVLYLYYSVQELKTLRDSYASSTEALPPPPPPSLSLSLSHLSSLSPSLSLSLSLSLALSLSFSRSLLPSLPLPFSLPPPPSLPRSLSPHPTLSFSLSPSLPPLSNPPFPFLVSVLIT